MVDLRRLGLLYGAIFLLLAHNAFAADTLHLAAKQNRLVTNGQVSIREYVYDFGTAGGDGALTVKDDDLILGTAEGHFFRIKNNLAVQKDALPSIDLGLQAFAAQKRYGYVEKPPRLHGLLYDRGTFYAAYDYYDAGAGAIRFVLASLAEGTAEWHTLFQSPPIDATYYAMGGGGRMTVRDNTLYFTTGDYSLDRKNNLLSDVAAQNPDLPFGKINRLNLVTGHVSVYSLGHRNPLGITADGNDLVISDNGPRGGDGVYRLEEGANYGWPLVSNGRQYQDFAVLTKPTRFEKYRNDVTRWIYGRRQDYRYPFHTPDLSFTPSIAPTQIIKLDHFYKEWDGDFLLGSLKARQLYRVHQEAGRMLFAEPIWVGQRLRDIVQHNNNVWLWTDAGTLMQLSISKDQTPYASTPPGLNGCMMCHSYSPDSRTPSPNAPNLYHVIGRRIGSSGYSGYSEAMKQAKGVWDHDTLLAFLLGPQAVVPGTAMPNLPYSTTAETAEDIIKALGMAMPEKK